MRTLSNGAFLSTPIHAVAAKLLVAAIAIASATLAAQEKDDSGTPKPPGLFEKQGTLQIEIEAPWRRLIRDRKDEFPYEGTMTWTDEAGQHTVPVTVERRGLTRQRVCAFPPIRLRMDKAVVKGTAFRGQKSLKLVTHCDKGDRWEQYYVKEMLAYRMYNLMTELSFRVRPLDMSYIESEGGSSQTRFAFAIEDDSDVAKRNGLEKLDVFEIDPKQLEPVQASRYALFQYMIGNADWSTLGGPGSEMCCHNAKLIGTSPDSQLVPIPYDFDSAGIVDAHYAAPNEGLPIRYVTDRLYRGFCAHNATLEAARQEILALESEIYALVQSEEQLSGRNVKVASRYLEEFFDTMKNDRAFEKEIIRACRK